MDLNKDQMLNFDELKLGLHKYGHQMPDADVQILMEAADADGNGSLDYGEFVTLSASPQCLLKFVCSSNFSDNDDIATSS
ncbi:EF-hand domain-containing protein, partial [Yangia sp. PrR004]|nr:EF-hand domain-containing protein [Salipiger sp. PrR004]